VPLPARVLDSLMDNSLPRSGWLFPLVGQPDRPRSANLIQGAANQHLHDLGISSTFHSLRHWFGTNVYRSTLDLRLTQDLLGHATPVMTALYTKVEIGQAAANATERIADSVP
jgi:integrase